MNISVKTNLIVAYVDKPKFTTVLSTVKWKLDFLNAHVYSLTAHHFIGLLCYSVCSRPHIWRHSLLHLLEFSKSLSSWESRRTYRPADENPTRWTLSILPWFFFTFTSRLRFTSIYRTFMSDVCMHTLPRWIDIFALIVNLLTLICHLSYL